jgi:hypothetical protein
MANGTASAQKIRAVQFANDFWASLPSLTAFAEEV